MKNKILLFGLFFALLQATVYGKRKKPDPPIIDEPLKINVDAGKERDSCMSLAKTIEEKQSLIDDALERMSAKIEALEERMTAEAKVAEDRCTQRMTAEAKTTEERWTQRMTAEAKATEERWNQRMTAEAKATEERWTQRMTAEANATEERWTQRMTAEAKATEDRMTAETKAAEDRCTQRMAAETKATEDRWNQRLPEAMKTAEGRMPAEFQRLNQKVVGLSNQLAKRTDVSIPQKRPAELACEKITNDLRSIGETTSNYTPYYAFWLYNSVSKPTYCTGAIIDKRFLITEASCVSTGNFRKLMLEDSVDRGIKAIHKHPDFPSETPSLNNIALIELESDVGYTLRRYPVCLYTSQVNPERDLMGLYGKIQIVADAKCFKKTGTDLKPSQICATDLEFLITYSGWPIYLVQENFPKHKLFGIAATETTNSEPFVITKVFDHLDFIESIVWPKSGN